MANAAQQIEEAISDETLADLTAATAQLNARQLWWASGYLAGQAAAAGATPFAEPAPVAAAADQAPALTILYASETGNARSVARQLAERATAEGIVARIEDLARYKPRQLRRERNVAIVAATHGLGDPPDGTEAFFEYWLSDNAPALNNLRFTVLALGDSSYEDFCKVGRDLDARLEALGGMRTGPRIDCDVDFDGEAGRWSAEVLRHAPAGSATAASPGRLQPRIRAVPPAHTRTQPFLAEILTNQKITGRHSTKDVRHLELSMEGSGLSYTPGDSLGVVPTNPAQLVKELLQVTGYSGEAVVSLGGRQFRLADALTDKLEITIASRAFVDAFAKVSDLDAPPPGPDARSWLAARQIIDIVAGCRMPADPQQFVDCMRGLTPRLYSIASSPDANIDEVHLTVRRVDYRAFGRSHLGAASSFLCTADSAPVFVEDNDRFRLPANPDTPVIMIGAGTGIAPYRAFVEHRVTHGDSGENWLIFGDRHQQSDFLYQLEWLRYRKQGVLSKLDVAFSRDQAEKVYVQQRLLGRGKELYQWLENGAHVYVCGDAESMAPAVHLALRDAVGRAAGVSEENAEQYLRDLKSAGRYQRDVY